MATANLAALRTKIADVLARPEADIANAFTDAVETFEDKFNNESRLAEMEQTATLTITSGIATLPADFLELRNVVGPNGDIAGSYYLSGLSLVFPSTDPDDAGLGSVTILYYAKVPPLVNDTDTNWLLQKAPYLYRYGVLLELALWIVDGSALQVYQERYDRAYQGLRDSDIGKRWGGMSVIISGPTP